MVCMVVVVPYPGVCVILGTPEQCLGSGDSVGGSRGSNPPPEAGQASATDQSNGPEHLQASLCLCSQEPQLSAGIPHANIR